MRKNLHLLALTLPATAALVACNLALGLSSIDTNGTGGSGPSSGSTGPSPTSTSTTSPSTTSTGSSSGTGGGDGGMHNPCVPSENAVAVADQCGVFVDNTAPSSAAKGTQEHPFASITAALAVSPPVIYVCGETFDEAVTITSGTVLYGALDCANGWVYDKTKRTTLAPTAAAPVTSVPVPLTLGQGSSSPSVSVYDFDIVAPDAPATPPTTPGTPGLSSIAIIDDGVSLTLGNVSITAGIGQPGLAGVDATPPMLPMAGNGDPGDSGCTSTMQAMAADGGTNKCGTQSTAGGAGGVGTAGVKAGTGGDGTPLGNNNGGGVGELAMPMPDAGTCEPGGPGDPGLPGTAGTPASSLGTVDASGYTPALATQGGAGTFGLGGGGGGGDSLCASNPGMGFTGPSGGGGGAGGCGGAPGTVGSPGGSSIGIILHNAQLTLGASVAIKAGAGGIGGDGGLYQLGGLGGLGGSSAACAGGGGGAGGRGGLGPGGAGGHSVGIATSAGGMVSNVSSGSFVVAPPASGGTSKGAGTVKTSNGPAGQSCAMLDFTVGASNPCTTMP